MLQAILSEIEKAPIICIFRHENPDSDALGSQFGLLTWIKKKYPEKKVYAMGYHRGILPQLFGRYEDVDDEIIKKSLAIITDTANAARIDDIRYTLAYKRIKIDHHPFTDNYAELEWIDDKAASSSELVTELIKYSSSDILCIESANYLYLGIIADTLRFSTRNTRPKTLEMAAYLLRSGLNLGELNDDLFALSKEELDFTSYLRAHAIYDGKIAYIIITQDDLNKLNIKQASAKEKVYELGLVRETEIWAMFIEQSAEEGGLYNGSLRSRRTPVNDIAKRFHGGGHILAAAVKGLHYEEIDGVIDILQNRLKEEK